jgi:hypothetical protein
MRISVIWSSSRHDPGIVRILNAGERRLAIVVPLDQSERQAVLVVWDELTEDERCEVSEIYGIPFES